MTQTHAAASEDIIPEKLNSLPIREVWKPDISKLPDAVVDGKFVLKAGQDLVIQYPQPWRETILWKVVKFYDETLPTEEMEIVRSEKGETIVERYLCIKGTTVRPGHVRLLDLQKGQYGATNYMTAAHHSLVLKVWIGKSPK